MGQSQKKNNICEKKDLYSEQRRTYQKGEDSSSLKNRVSSTFLEREVLKRWKGARYSNGETKPQPRKGENLSALERGGEGAKTEKGWGNSCRDREKKLINDNEEKEKNKKTEIRGEKKRDGESRYSSNDWVK